MSPRCPCDLKIGKLAKFESDLLKTNDIARKSRGILNDVCMVAGKVVAFRPLPLPPPYKRLLFLIIDYILRPSFQ